MPNCSQSGRAARPALLVANPALLQEVRLATELARRVIAIGWPGSKSPSTSCRRTAQGLYGGPGADPENVR